MNERLHLVRNALPGQGVGGPIKGRWLDINKGDDKNKVYRSRYVAMETRKMHGGNGREGTISADASSRGAQMHEKDAHKMMFIDIS